MIVAHRGASYDAPENTLPAFTLAWEQGADAVEADFHLTKDGHIVCIHNGDTKSVAKENLVVCDSTLDELRKLDVGAQRGEAFKGTRIPTISEVFAVIPEQKKIFIEIKSDAQIIPVLLREIDKSGLKKEQVAFICFNGKIIQELKAQAPQYKAHLLCSFEKQVTGKITPSLETVLNTLKVIQSDGIDANSAMPESFIEPIIKQGYEWHVWTIDDLKTAKRMADLGVRSITTNRPGYLRAHLVE